MVGGENEPSCPKACLEACLEVLAVGVETEERRGLSFVGNTVPADEAKRRRRGVALEAVDCGKLEAYATPS